MQEHNWADLISRVAQGDQHTFGAFYDGTSRLVYGLALRILGNPSAAEEVTIDVYVQVWRQAAHYNQRRGSPATWLLTLARSRAIDRLRSMATKQQREEPLEAAAAVPAPTVDPELVSAASEQRRQVQAALATLTPEQRQVIELAYFCGLSHSEIATKLGAPLGTIKTRIRLAMMKLHELLRPLRRA
jgi:RNA polymerase sigma-70 factor (ECF subfamily)